MRCRHDVTDCRWVGEKLGIVEKEKLEEDDDDEEEEEPETRNPPRKGSSYPNKGFQPDSQVTPRKGVKN